MPDVEILVMKATKPNDGSWEEGNWTSNDPEEARIAPTVWGREESKQQWISDGFPANEFPNKFYIMHITNVPQAQADYLVANTGQAGEAFRPALPGIDISQADYDFKDPSDRFVRRARNEFNFDYDSLNQGDKNKIDGDAFLQMPWSQFNTKFTSKFGGGTIP